MHLFNSISVYIYIHLSNSDNQSLIFLSSTLSPLLSFTINLYYPVIYKKQTIIFLQKIFYYLALVNLCRFITVPFSISALYTSMIPWICLFLLLQVTVHSLLTILLLSLSGKLLFFFKTLFKYFLFCKALLDTSKFSLLHFSMFSEHFVYYLIGISVLSISYFPVIYIFFYLVYALKQVEYLLCFKDIQFLVFL